MEIELRKCKNEECQSILADDDKHKYCAVCRKARSERRMQTFVDLLCAPGIVAMNIATKRNRHYQKNDDK